MAFEKVAALSELTAGVPVRVVLDGTPIAVVRDGDEVFAIHDTCSHQDYSLSEGMVFDCQVECALHGSMFDLRTGAPASLPATTAVPTYAVTVDGDAVLVDVAAQTNDAPVPDHD
ncbi:MAG: non-heme iron oxygenase ferredoxin subunit [Actinomycetes bacterium]